MIDDATRLGDEGPGQERTRRQFARNRPVRVSVLTRGLLGGLLAAIAAVAVLLDPHEQGRRATRPEAAHIVSGDTLVSSLGFSPDGRTLAVGYAGGELRLCEVAAQSSRVVAASRSVISSLSFAPDGQSLVLADHGATIYRYDPATLQPLSPLQAPGYEFTTLCFSHDGRTLAAGDAQGRLALWDVARARIRSVLEGHRGVISALVFSHDDHTLASGGGVDGTIRLSDATRGVPERVLPGHPSIIKSASMYRVIALAFSTDDRTLVSGGGFDRYVRLWDVRSGEALETRQLDPSATFVSYVAFTPPLTLPDGLEDVSHAMMLQWKCVRSHTVLAGCCKRSLRMAMSHDGRNLAIGDWTDVLAWQLRNPPSGSDNAPRRREEGILERANLEPPEASLLLSGPT